MKIEFERFLQENLARTFGELMAKNGKVRSFDDVLNFLIQQYEKA